jgi:AAA+ ATPase superfamily predicted ATPase
MRFVNRASELKLLDEWHDQPGARLGIVWGRRRVGKTYLLSHWAKKHRTVFHVARNRSPAEELAALSVAAAPVVTQPFRDLATRPFANWDDAFETFAAAAMDEPLVVLIDEFPELIQGSPGIESALRAIWERLGGTKLRLLLCGSAVRTMEALQAERAPLFGRANLRMQVRPFTPGEAALMLPALSPIDRARAWGVCGGTPFYLSLWDSDRSFRDNLYSLFGTEQGMLLNEGNLLLATEDFAGGRRERIPEQLLRAIAAGRTRFAELKSDLGADPTRPLGALRDLGLVERVLPVGPNADPRRAYYRVADNFLAFWLSVVEPHRPAIARRLGRSIADVLVQQFDDFMGDRWEEAFRAHLANVLADDPRVYPMVELGRFWKQYGQDPSEIDAVVLSGRERRLTLAGEAKWARTEDGRRMLRDLRRKVVASDLMKNADDDPIFALCAREQVTGDLPADTLVVTAADIFG